MKRDNQESINKDGDSNDNSHIIADNKRPRLIIYNKIILTKIIQRPDQTETVKVIVVVEVTNKVEKKEGK